MDAAQSPEQLLETLFNSFDTNHSGYLRKTDLRQLCKGISLTDDEFETIFNELDQDRDEQISKADFVQGFAESHELFLQTPPPSPRLGGAFSRVSGSKPNNESISAVRNSTQKPVSNGTVGVGRMDSVFSQTSLDDGQMPGERGRRTSWKQFTEDIGLDYYLMSQEGQEEVWDMYQKLADPTTQHLLENFENVVTSLVKEVKKIECENERVEKSFKREKEEHGRHLKQLEDEMEAQVTRIEARVRKQEQERHDQEKLELKTEFESEILQLQDNLKKLQKLEVPVQGDSAGMKGQLEELCQENRLLKRSLTDVQTNLALQRSELVTLRQSYEDKKRELGLEKQTLMDYIREQESLSKQVLMLQEANKTLLDANDDIRATLDSSVPTTPNTSGNESLMDVMDGVHYQQALIYFIQDGQERVKAAPLSLGLSSRMDHKADYVREYLSSSPLYSFEKPVGVPMSSCLAEELSKSTSARTRRVLPSQDSVEVDDVPEDRDSGHSTLQGIAEVDMELDRHSCSSRNSNTSREDSCNHRPRKKTRGNRVIPLHLAHEDSLASDHESLVYNMPLQHSTPQRTRVGSLNTSDLEVELGRISPLPQSYDLQQMQQSHDLQRLPQSHDLQRIPQSHDLQRIPQSHDLQRAPLTHSHAHTDLCSHSLGFTSQCIQVSEPSLDEADHICELEEECERVRPSFSRANSTCSQCSEHSRNSLERRGHTFRRKYNILEPPISSTPERMYKVVLCGDAAVGKSSFIMRLCKNKFVNNLNSTLGVDFQTKTLVVDGRCIALQLWDTAGQERFRSIAKSYFRRADGVLLLYDCSYERSFISVRDWMQTVEDGAQNKIPVMLVGNKTDLRGNKQGGGERCVSKEEGHRLAREFDAVFIETSAKSGNNVHEAALEFSRLLKSNEDMEVKTVGMQLHDMKVDSEKDRTCCM